VRDRGLSLWCYPLSGAARRLLPQGQKEKQRRRWEQAGHAQPRSDTHHQITLVQNCRIGADSLLRASHRSYTFVRISGGNRISVKIFVSYTSADRRWAHWIAWQLREAGHEPFIHEWEIGAGQNIPRWMEERIDQADHLIGVFSDTYSEAIYSRSERWAAYWEDPEGRIGFLIPIEVVKVTKWPRLVKPLNRLSLIGLSEPDAAERLGSFLEPRKPPSEKPTFPGSAAPNSSIFTDSSEPLGTSPPSFPAVSSKHQSAASGEPAISAAADLNLNIRCVDDHEPKPKIFGREDEIETVVDALLKGQMILIAGGPGMGKTSIATTAIYDPRVVAYFERRRIFASLETATEPRAILAKLVEALGFTPTGDEVTLFRILEANAAERPLAAVLDNAETVFDADRGGAERLLTLIAQVHGLSLAVTLRGVAPPIPNAAQIDNLLKLSPSAARDAFLAVAGISFKGDLDLPHILDALDGHALSIRLVAAQAIGSPSLAGLRESWDEAKAEILHMSGEKESRLTSVRASLALSLNSKRMKSTPLARRLMSLLAFLPGGLIDLDARALLGERGAITKARANDAISCLHQLRLVESRPDRRLRMLTPLRESVKSDLPPLEIDQNRIIERYLSLAAKAYTIGQPDWGTFRNEVEAEADNLDSICEIAVATKITHRRLEEALHGIAKFHLFTGRGDIGSVEHAVARLKLRPPSRFVAGCMYNLGDIARTRGDHLIANARFNEALTLYRHLGAKSGQANCLRGLGAIAETQSDYETAKARYAEASALFRSAGNVLGEANCIQGLGDIARTYHEETATDRFDEALVLFRSIRDILGEANCIHGLGDIASSNSDHDRADAYFKEAQEMFRRVGNISGEADCIHSLGGIARAQMDLEKANDCFEQALAVFRRVGSVISEANCIVSLGDVALAQFADGVASARYNEALKLYQRIGGIRGEADCIWRIGDIARVRFDYEAAIMHYNEALVLLRHTGATEGEAPLLVRRGQVKRAMGDRTQGLIDIEAGFALRFKHANPKDRALSGSRAMHRALTCEDEVEANSYRELAKSSWTAIGRLDLAADWASET
jgi:tetratricopeptide (TPR) repeat protein